MRQCDQSPTRWSRFIIKDNTTAQRLSRNAPDAPALHVFKGKAGQKKQTLPMSSKNQARPRLRRRCRSQNLQHSVPHLPFWMMKYSRKMKCRALSRLSACPRTWPPAPEIIFHIGIGVHGPSARGLKLPLKSFGARGIGFFRWRPVPPGSAPVWGTAPSGQAPAAASRPGRPLVPETGGVQRDPPKAVSHDENDPVDLVRKPDCHHFRSDTVQSEECSARRKKPNRN